MLSFYSTNFPHQYFLYIYLKLVLNVLGKLRYSYVVENDNEFLVSLKITKTVK
jgi:hypothetical protein